MSFMSLDGHRHAEVCHLRSQEFSDFLIKWIPVTYHELVIVGLEKELPWFNRYIEATLDDQLDIQKFIETLASKWFHLNGGLFPDAAWVRKDGFVIEVEAHVSLNFVAECFLHRKLETANRNYARITPHVYSVEEAIKRVSRPSNAMKVSVFNFLVERSKRGT